MEKPGILIKCNLISGTIEMLNWQKSVGGVLICFYFVTLTRLVRTHFASKVAMFEYVSLIESQL